MEENIAYEKDESILILSKSDSKSDSWVIDFRAFFHATSCMDCFTNYHEGQFREVFLGDNKSYEIVGKGDILLQLEDGGKWLLKNVHHVPKLKRKLISVSQLFCTRILSILTSGYLESYQGFENHCQGKQSW